MQPRTKTEIKPGLVVLLVFIAFILGAYFMAWVGFTETWPQDLGTKVKALDGWADVFVSTCAAIISGLAVYFVRKTLVATQEMVTSQQEMLDLEYRPLVTVTAEEAIPVIEFSETRLDLRFNLSNYGRMAVARGFIRVHLHTENSEYIANKPFQFITPNDGSRSIEVTFRPGIAAMSGHSFMSGVAYHYYISPLGRTYGEDHEPLKFYVHVNSPAIGPSVARLTF